LLTRSSFTWKPLKEKYKTKYGQTKTKIQLYPTSSSELKTLKYIQTNVHDFAWFADKRFIVKHDTCHLASGKVIDAYTFYTPTESETWKNSLQTIEDAIRTRSEWVGEYPYNVVSAVQGPDGFGGGMEYPTITLISPQANEKLLEFTIAHEVGHNWFYGILGTNEYKEAAPTTNSFVSIDLMSSCDSYRKYPPLFTRCVLYSLFIISILAFAFIALPSLFTDANVNCTG